MVCRFFSGSYTFLSLAKNSSDASSTRKFFMPSVSNASFTRTTSFFRMRPVSMRSPCTRSVPSTLLRSVKATEESTPPETSMNTLRSPTSFFICSEISAPALSTDHGAALQSAVNRLRISTPCSVCVTSGWNWMAKKLRLSSEKAAFAHASDVPNRSNP